MVGCDHVGWGMDGDEAWWGVTMFGGAWRGEAWKMWAWSGCSMVMREWRE